MVNLLSGEWGRRLFLIEDQSNTSKKLRTCVSRADLDDLLGCGRERFVDRRASLSLRDIYCINQRLGRPQSACRSVLGGRPCRTSADRPPWDGCWPGYSRHDQDGNAETVVVNTQHDGGRGFGRNGLRTLNVRSAHVRNSTGKTFFNDRLQ